MLKHEQISPLRLVPLQIRVVKLSLLVRRRAILIEKVSELLADHSENKNVKDRVTRLRNIGNLCEGTLS